MVSTGFKLLGRKPFCSIREVRNQQTLERRYTSSPPALWCVPTATVRRHPFLRRSPLLADRRCQELLTGDCLDSRYFPAIFIILTSDQHLVSFFPFPESLLRVLSLVLLVGPCLSRVSAMVGATL